MFYHDQDHFHWGKQALPWIQHHWPHVLLIGNVYLFLNVIYQQSIFQVQHSKHPPSSILQMVNRMWNLCWGIFSLAGAVGSYPALFRLVQSNNTLDLCNVDQAIGPDVFWIFLYVFTKPLELFDTLLLMMKGRPVRLIHWSHHAITMLFTWYAALHNLKPALLFAFMNFAVHAIMYLYYFLVSFSWLRTKLRQWAWMITVVQMSQFVFALFSLIYFQKCYTFQDLTVSSLMYSYYLLLFGQLFCNRFVR